MRPIQTQKHSLLKIKLLFSLLLTFSLLFNISGCSQAPKKNNQAQVYQKLNDLRDKYASQNQQYYGIGTGSTPEEAVQNARIDLANQILTLVQKKTTRQLQVIQGQDGEKVSGQYRRQQNIQAATFSAVELENTQVIQQQSLNNTYYAVVGADAATITKIKAKAKRTAAALVAINQLQQTQLAADKVQLLEQGVQAMQRFHIEDETLLINGERYTFKAWFDQQLQQLRQQIKTAVTKDNEVFAIYFLDANTLDPISGIKVQINQQQGYTDKIGRMVVASLPKTSHIRLVLNDKPHLLNTFIQGSSLSTLYVNTQPKGFVAELKENDKTIASITTPEAIPLEVKANNNYKLVVHSKGQYPELNKTLSLTPGFDAVFYKQFEKLTYGAVDLKLSSDDDELKLISPKGQQLYVGTEGYKNSKLQVGSYQVSIQRADHDPEYQIVDDEFVLAKDQSIKRHYFSPQYRQFYRRGSIWSLGFIAGGSPNENAQYRTSSGTFSGKDLNYDPTSFGYSIAYRYFNTYAFWGGGLGLVSTSDKSHTIYSTTNLTGFPLSVMGGVYRSFNGNLLLLEGGYRRLNLSQSTTSYQTLETDISSPFVGVHYFAGGFQLGIRYFTAQNSTLGFYIAWGANDLESGYELPAHVKAQPGEHYEVLK